MVLLTIAMLALAAPVQASQSRTYAGRSVADVLQELQTPELKIIFSTDLVPPALRVKAEPQSKDPREIARQILEPHGLTLQAGPRGTLLVVALPRKESSPPRQQTPRPPAQKPPGDPGRPPDPIRIEEEVNVVDRLTEGSGLAKVYTLRPTDIRETAGSLENVLMTLQLLPGVAAVNDADGKLAVRGSGPEHNLIVIDGVQIHNPQRFGEFTSSFANPAIIANVTLDASGLEARHGGRLSSVTTFETRDGSRSRRFAFSGSAGLTSGDATVEGRLPGTESGSWWASLRGTYYRLVSDRFIDGTEPGFTDLQAKISVRPSERTRLAVFALAGRESALEREGLNQERTWADLQADNRLGVMSLTWNPGPRLVTTTTLSAYAHDERYTSDFSLVGISPFERVLRVHDFAARQRVLYGFSSRHVLDAGIDLHRFRSGWRMTGGPEPEARRGLGPTTWGEQIDFRLGPVETALTRTQAGFWLQDRLPIGSNATLEPGVRLDWNSYTGEAAWQPRLRATTRVGGADVWAGYAMQVQTPSHEALQGLDYFHLTPEVGSQLRNERSRQAVAGVERPVGAGFDLRVEAYYRWFGRLMVQRVESEEEWAQRLLKYEIPPDMPPDSALLERRPTIHPESTGRGIAKGIEFLLQRRAGRVNGWISYTFSKSTREVHGHTILYDYDRPHAAAAAGTYQISRRFRAAATLQFASAFPITPEHEEVVFSPGAFPVTSDTIWRPVRHNGALLTRRDPFVRRLALRNSGRLNPYSRVDIRVTFSTLGHWEFYGELMNVFDDRHYVETIEFEPGFPGPGRRSVYRAFGRLPTFGVRVSF